MGECALCGGFGHAAFVDPVTGRQGSMLCPTCTPEGVDLDPQVEDEYDDYAGDLAYEGSW